MNFLKTDQKFFFSTFLSDALFVFHYSFTHGLSNGHGMTWVKKLFTYLLALALENIMKIIQVNKIFSELGCEYVPYERLAFWSDQQQKIFSEFFKVNPITASTLERVSESRHLFWVAVQNSLNFLKRKILNFLKTFLNFLKTFFLNFLKTFFELP